MTDPESSFPKLASLLSSARAKGPLTVAVAYPCSDDSLGAAISAAQEGLIVPVLVGPRERIEACAKQQRLNLDGLRIVESPDDGRAASYAAAGMASRGEVAAIMKGSQHTDELLSAVLSRDFNLRTGRRLSHVFWFDLPSYSKPLLLTDAVVNIAPTLEEKADILRNAVDLARALGVEKPKVALLSSVETVNPALPSSIDAALLAKMADRGQITGATVDGPLAFDNAISRRAAEEKGIFSSVAGDPDILVVANLDVGNALYKSFVYMAGGECAGVAVGARTPIILTSRADSQLARRASCALARLICDG